VVIMGKISFIIVLVITALYANGQDDKTLIVKGNELYKNKEYDKAASEYQKATDINQKNSKAQYNLGDALYKSKKNGAAQKAFDAAAEGAKDETFKSRAVYNKGVSLTREKKLQESIDAYKDALRLNPTDDEARDNLQKALNELKKQPEQKQNKQNQDKNKNKNNDNNNPPPQNKSKLNQKQAERMLNALRQEEKKLQQDQQKKNKVSSSQDKDW
jgi:Ca-activated chloride channel homolog